MKKFFKFAFKKILVILLCCTMCFSCVMLTTACTFGDPGKINGSGGTGGSGGTTGGGTSGGGSGNTGGNTGGGTSGGTTGGGTTGGGTGGTGTQVQFDEDISSSTNTTYYYLTINANGGLFKQKSTYIVKANKNSTYTLENPTNSNNTLIFGGWTIQSGKGTLSDSKFTFGEGNAEIKATWITDVYDEDISNASKTAYYLTINANGGLFKEKSTYIVKANKDSTYTLENPTNESSDLNFAGWVMQDGKGTLSGSTFTFGDGDAEIKATWEGGILGDDTVDINDYLAGGRFTYKPEPELLRGTDYVEKVKTQLNTIGTDIWARLLNFYLDGASYSIYNDGKYYEVDAINHRLMYTEYNGTYDELANTAQSWNSILNYGNPEKSSILANYKYHLQFLYAGVISGQYEKQADNSYKVKDESSFVTDLDYILNGGIEAEIEKRYNERIENYAIYIDHIGLLDYEKEILVDLILNEIIGNATISTDINYTDNDKVNGFGAEMYFNDLSSTNLSDVDFSYEDANNNGLFDDGEAYTIKENHAHMLELFSGGTPKFLDSDYDSKFDCWTKETFIAKGYCTEETYDHAKYFYHIYYEDNQLKWEFSDGNATLTKDPSIGMLMNNTFVPKEGYEFDIRLQGFKNYKVAVSNIVDYIADARYENRNGELTEEKVYPHMPALYVQDLALNEMTVELDQGIEGDLFNSTIISNNQDSGVSMQSVIFNVKKEMLLQNMTILFEFLDDNIASFNLNLKIRFYDASTQTLYEFNIGDFIIDEGECDLVFGDSVDIDFTDIAARVGMESDGFLIQPYSSILNDGVSIKNGSVGYNAEILSQIQNYEKCFEIYTNESGQGAASKYTDITSSFFEIVFDAEKIDGVTPNYKVSFMSVEIADPSKNN